MRQLIFFLLILSAGLAQAQTTTSTQYLGAPKTLVRNRGSFQVDSLGSVSDTAAYKAVVATADGLFRRMSRWPAGMGGGYNPADTLLIRRDSIFIFTSDTVYYIGTVDPTLYNKVDSVTFGTSQYVDTVKYHVNGTEYVAGYIDKISPCDNAFSGGVVVYDEGTLTANISPSPYYHINCRRYSSTGGQVTHDPPDATYPRYDIVAFDTLGNVVIIEGTPAENPSIPYVDETLYKALTTTLIIPGDTDPADLSTEVIYNENTEWTTARTIPAGTFTSTAQVFTGTVSSSVIGWANGQYLQFTNSTELSPSAYQTFSFWLRLTANMANNQNISVQFFNGSTAVSNSVTATITKNAVNTWQLVGFTIGQFTFTQPTFTRVRIIFSGSSASTLYVDLVRLQGGVSQGGGTTSQPLVITDGTTNVTVKTPLKFRGDGKVTFTVGSNTQHGDYVLGNINVDSLTGQPITNITGLQDALDARVIDVKWYTGTERDTMVVEFANGEQLRYVTPLNHFNSNQFTVTHIDGGDSIDLLITPSAATPDSVLWRGLNGVIYQSPATGVGIDSVHITQPDDNTLVFAQMRDGDVIRTDTIVIDHPVSVSSISLATENVLYNTPVNFINTSGAWNGTLTLKSQTQNTVLAAPNGSSGTPSFRSLVAADIPNIDASKITSGTFDAARLASGTPAAGYVPTYSSGSVSWAAQTGSGGGSITLPHQRIPFGDASGSALASSPFFFYDSTNKRMVLNNVYFQQSSTAFNINYLTVSARSTNHGISAAFQPSGTPTAFGYDFSLLNKESSATSLKFVGDVSNSKHAIAIDNSNAQKWPMVFKVGTASWSAATDVITLATTGKVGINALASPNSHLDVSGSFGAAITTLSTNTTLTDAHYTVLVDATAGNVTITLPTAASTTNRRIYIIKKIDASANTVTFTTAEGTQTLSTQWSGKQVQSSSSAWYIIGNF